MKRFSLLILGLAFALVAASSASAKTKVRKSNNTGSIPCVKTIDKLVNKLDKTNRPTRVVAPDGIKMLAKRTARDGMMDEVAIVYGNNVKATVNRNFSITATATGPHAWYFEYLGSDDHYYGIYFYSEDDRDAFWQEFKKSSSWYSDEVMENCGLDCYFTTEYEWYGINLEPH